MSHLKFVLRLFFVALLCNGCNPGAAQGALKVADVPAFQWRARIVSIDGAAPVGKTFNLNVMALSQPPEKVSGNAWTPWVPFGAEQIAPLLERYPNPNIQGFPFVARLNFGGVAAAKVNRSVTGVEVELKLDETGQTVPLRGELIGPSLGILLWRDDQGTPHAGTMADYNQRYWDVFEKSLPKDAKRPVHFPIADRFIAGDDDLIAWRGGINAFASEGVNTLMAPAKNQIGALLRAQNLKTAWATYKPLGGLMPFSEAGEPATTPELIQKWAGDFADSYRAAGFAPREMAMFGISDEPAWYYPNLSNKAAQDPATLELFRQYLRDQGLQASDVGAPSWNAVTISMNRGAQTLPEKRLFYWSARFLSWSMEQHYARSTRAMESAFYPGLPIYTNFNNFAGRFYTPGPFGNNTDKDSPDAAIGAPDWMEFGRLRSGTLLTTEDWFNDAGAPQWSFYMAKLTSAARASGVETGALIVPRTSGDRADGLFQKILACVGNGAKGIQYFVFGPEYVFPGNCYSENDLSHLMPQMARAHTIIAQAEDILWPAKRLPSPVAILSPRSSQPWDARNEKGVVLVDSTNANFNRSRMAYEAEVFDLYYALQSANVPTDIVEEDDLAPNKLKNVKVLFVTEPNIPSENQRALLEWVRAGGTLVTVVGAATRDRYDEPTTILSQASGIDETAPRLILKSGVSIAPVAKVSSETETIAAYGARGVIQGAPQGVVAHFEDGTPATLSREVGQGHIVHFAWLPGLSYIQSATGKTSGLATGFSKSARAAILAPIQAAGVVPPVTLNVRQVEAPMLVAPNGAIITILNWTGKAQPDLQVTVRAPFIVKSVQSTTRGALKFAPTKDGIVFPVPLDAADMLVLRP